VYQWCGFKSSRGKNKNLTALKSNSNTVWFNFRTYIIFSINLVSLVTLRSSGTDILYGCHLLLDVCIHIYRFIATYSVINEWTFETVDGVKSFTTGSKYHMENIIGESTPGSIYHGVQNTIWQVFYQTLKMIEHNFINNEVSDTGSIEPLVHFSSNFNAVFLAKWSSLWLLIDNIYFISKMILNDTISHIGKLYRIYIFHPILTSIYFFLLIDFAEHFWMYGNRFPLSLTDSEINSTERNKCQITKFELFYVLWNFNPILIFLQNDHLYELPLSQCRK
jgi:hypothetical protein